MRYFSAALTLLLGLLLLGLGIGQLNAENEETRTTRTEGAQQAPFTVITDEIIDTEADRDEFTIEAEGDYTVAMGRSYDIEAWIGDAAHNRITGFVEAEGDEPAHFEAEYIDGEAQAPDPAESDLWVATETTEGDLLYRWNTPDESGDWAMLMFRDGEEPAPASITTEQTETGSQATGIGLTIAGGLVILISLGLFYWASKSRRKDSESNGTPKTKDGDQPMTDSTETAVAPAAHQTTTTRTEFALNRSAFSGLAAVVLATASALGLAGPVHAEETGTPQSPEPESESEGDVEVPDQIPAEGYSVLLSSQLETILADVAEIIEDGDAEQDAQLLEDRVAGEALLAREIAYRNHDVAEAELPAPVGTEVLSAAVTSDPEFPRQAMVITDHPEGEVPQILVLEQQSPRENYQLVHTSVMAPGTEFPSLSPEQGGTEPVDPASETEGMAPDEAVSGVAQYFTDPDHDFGANVAESVYIDNLHSYYQNLTEAADDTEVNFPDAQPRESHTSLRLPDGSTVVAGSFERAMQMAPLEDGDTIFLEDDLVVELVGTDWTTFPTEILSLESVVLHLPAEGSDEDVVLLGVHDIIEDATIETPDWFDGYDGD